MSRNTPASERIGNNSVSIAQMRDLQLIRMLNQNLTVDCRTDTAIGIHRQRKQIILLIRRLQIIQNAVGNLIRIFIHRAVCKVTLLPQQHHGAVAIIACSTLSIIPYKEIICQVLDIPCLKIISVNITQRCDDKALSVDRVIILLRPGDA